MAKTKARVGDLIQVLENGHKYSKGDILAVENVVFDAINAGGSYFYDREYEIYRKQAHAAHVGDLIRITKIRDEITTYKLGGIYEVISLDASNYDQIVIKGEGGAVGFVFADEYEVFCKAGEEESDAVNSPQHYTQGRFETIEIIEEIAKGYDDGFTAYCVGNALKYLARAPYKHEEPTEDLRKAERYLRFAIDGLTRK